MPSAINPCPGSGVNSIDAQLADVIELRDDADQRGWTDDTTRHQHVAEALTRHLRTIDNRRSNPAAS